MTSDRQRFWWAVDAAVRRLPPGGCEEVRVGNFRAWIEYRPSTVRNLVRYRLYVDLDPGVP